MHPTNREKILNSRDVIARIDELQNARDDLQGGIDDIKEADAYSAQDLYNAETELTAWKEANEEELTALESLQDQAEGLRSPSPLDADNSYLLAAKIDTLLAKMEEKRP